VAKTRSFATVPPVPLPQAWLTPLHEWQVRALTNWYDNGCTGAVEAVTGTGKTHLGLEAAAQNAARGHPTTVIVPSLELQAQWRERFRRYTPDLRISTVGGDARGNARAADVVIATVHSAIKNDLSFGDPGSLLVADEMHRYGAEKWSMALRGDYGRRLGLTATLERSDDAVDDIIRPYFSRFVSTYGFEQALRDDVVAPFNLYVVPVELTNVERQTYDGLCRSISDILRKLRAAGALGGGDGSFAAKLRAVAGSGGPLARQAQAAESAIRKRRDLLCETSGKLDAVQKLSTVVRNSDGTIVFTQSVAMAEAAAEGLRESGTRASALHAGMDPSERRSNLAALEDGRVAALTAPKLLDEGIDVPRVDLGVVLTASKSRRQMIQRLGRVLRRKSGGRSVDFVIVYAHDTIEDPEAGAHEGFLDTVVDVASTSTRVDAGWLEDWDGVRLADLPVAPEPVPDLEELASAFA